MLLPFILLHFINLTLAMSANQEVPHYSDQKLIWPFSCAVFNILEWSVSLSHCRYTHLPYHPFLPPPFTLSSDSPALTLWILCWALRGEHINFSLVLCVQILFWTTKQRHDRTPASVSWGLVNCFVCLCVCVPPPPSPHRHEVEQICLGS